MDHRCEILQNVELKSSYYRIVFRSPEIAAAARGGQFVHVRIERARDRVLRRPFSVSDVDPAAGTLTLVYKVVGCGTRELAAMRPGEYCRILGPLGNAYTAPGPDTFPVLVAGGYGAAALYLVAKHAPAPGVFLLGARTKDDLIMMEDFQKLGFQVLIATDDGSAGKKGMVTDLLADAVSGRGAGKCWVYGCGPTPMLRALGKLTRQNHMPAELSVDQHMCCGVGACFACVVKVKDDSSPEGWRFSRSCREGPVYNAAELYYG